MRKVKAHSQVRAVKYMRYSTHNQDDGMSIEYQRENIERYAEKNNIELVGEYVDEAYSGTNDRRPGYQKMLEDARNKPDWNAVIVFDTSRFSRDVLDALRYEDELKSLGIKLLYSSQHFEDSCSGEIVKLVTLALDASHPKKTSDYVKAAHTTKAKRAQHVGGKPPLGYTVNPNGYLEIDKEAAPIVREIFDMFESGYSYARMAKKLNEKGYRATTGNPFRKNSFNSILQQEKYTGTYVWNKRREKNRKGQRNNHAYKPEDEWVIIENAFPAIISKEQFDRVQEKLEQRASGKANSKARNYYMLGSLKILKCSCCGSYLVGSVVASHNKHYLVYRCPNHKSSGCPTKDIRAEQLEKYVANRIVNNCFIGVDLRALSHEVNSSAVGYRKLREKQRKTEAELIRLVKVAKRCDSSTVAEEIERLEAERQNIKAKIEAAKTDKVEITKHNLREIKKKVFNYIRKSDDLEARQYLQEVVKQISVSNDDVIVELNVS